LMQQLEDAQKTIDVHAAKLKEEEDGIQSDIVQIDGRIKEVEGQIAGVESDRTELTDGIDDAMLKCYEAILKNKGDSALVAANAGTCGGCYMKIPTQLVHDSKNPEKMTLCSYCGRMLYFDL